jgi:hypothetical protein
MPNLAHHNGAQIDRVHSDAICREIGATLSLALGSKRNELPPRLLALMDTFAKVGLKA